MDHQYIPNEYITEITHAHFDSLHTYIVNEVRREFEEKKSFRDFHYFRYFKTWLQNVEPDCTNEQVDMAKTIFYDTINENWPAFQQLSLKIRFLVYLAINAPIPKAFADLLTNTCNLRLSLLDRSREMIDFFTMNDCTCAARELVDFRCIITRSTLTKCHWERVFDEVENRRIARRRATPTYTILRTPPAAPGERPQDQRTNIVVHLYL